MKKQKWKPTSPVSKGAEMYHNSVVNTSWYNDNLSPIVSIFERLPYTNPTVVDFGAGTGISSIFLIERIKSKFKLLLVDNSPSWLGKAYELLKNYARVGFYILEKKSDNYATLAETIGESTADMVISANTVHLIPDLLTAVKGIYDSLKPGGFLILQSGNIKRSGRKKGILMIDDTVENIHELAIQQIKTKSKYSRYKFQIAKRIISEESQRRFIFPSPRNISFYRNSLVKAGFTDIKIQHKPIKVRYADWMKFLRIRRIQAGILPEIGGRNPTILEENDRDDVIASSSTEYFDILRKKNPLATDEYFIAEWTYITARRPGK